jgi:putative restriction endonuclease
MFYWVNQGKTYKEEKEGGYLWAPVKNSSGKTFFYWTNMKKLRPKDLIFNYRKGYVIGYCIIKSESYLAPQPEEFSVDVEWEDEGFMADAEYYLLDTPISALQTHNKIADLLPSKYGPLNAIKKDGQLKVMANQGYLYELSKEIGETLIGLFKIKNDQISVSNNDDSNNDSDYKIPDKTSREGLVTSRVGQGEYRRRILKRWGFKCAVNGSRIKEVLIASHIVPWRESNNAERLDVDNGILLSPVYDALFDRHYISFDDDGVIILSKALSKVEFSKIGVDGSEKIENLTAKNKIYLERHRKKLTVVW